MTSEDDFQRAIDANPGDWQTRLVFADWLQEQGDPRADGHRAIVAVGVVPVYWSGSKLWGWYTQDIFERHFRNKDGPDRFAVIPDDWYAKIKRHPTEKEYAAEPPTAHEAFDDLARAFTALPTERKAALLIPRNPRHRKRKGDGPE